MYFLKKRPSSAFSHLLRSAIFKIKSIADIHGKKVPTFYDQSHILWHWYWGFSKKKKKLNETNQNKNKLLIKTTATAIQRWKYSSDVKT